jgi:hypothetical protein
MISSKDALSFIARPNSTLDTFSSKMFENYSSYWLETD